MAPAASVPAAAAVLVSAGTDTRDGLRPGLAHLQAVAAEPVDGDREDPDATTPE